MARIAVRSNACSRNLGSTAVTPVSFIACRLLTTASPRKSMPASCRNSERTRTSKPSTGCRSTTIDNSSSVPFIKAASAWAATSGNAGEGVRIAIIDTGSRLLARELRWTRYCCGLHRQQPSDHRARHVPDSESCRRYETSPATLTPAPTCRCRIRIRSTAMDTARTSPALPAAWVSTPTARPFLVHTTTRRRFLRSCIGPGVAPRAEIYSLKMFGCAGSTGLTTQAINLAVDPNGDGDPSDHVDVINMSLGSNFGTATDASAAASSNASLAGVIVVASAGNAGDTHYIVSSPATSTARHCVGNIVDWGNQQRDPARSIRRRNCGKQGGVARGL